jgi:hypothetical protein
MGSPIITAAPLWPKNRRRLKRSRRDPNQLEFAIVSLPFLKLWWSPLGYRRMRNGALSATLAIILTSDASLLSA